MSLSMYQASVPPAIQTLRALKAILGKAQAHCDARKIDPNAFLQSRLFPDMFPLTRQVQIACDVAKGCGARLAGIEVPKYEDNEVTFVELQARIEKTINFLKSIPEASINGSEQKQIKLQAGPRELEFVGDYFLRNWALPNVYFHTTTTYNILRHNGVELGKQDFLGKS